MFRFENLKHSTVRRGVKVVGKITYKDIVVGSFSQEPYAACIPLFTDAKYVKLFSKGAANNDPYNTEYAEQLLCEAEERLIASM